MTIITIGIDLAKNVFAVHGVDESGKPTLVRPEVRYRLSKKTRTGAACMKNPQHDRRMDSCVRGNDYLLLI